MRQRYGQHFLRNGRAISALLRRFAASPEDRVVEIGPGRGALTLELAASSGPFAAVEIDRTLAETLAERLRARLVTAADLVAARAPGGAVRRGAEPCVVAADALEVSYKDLAKLLGADRAHRLRVVGNLPYGVATALLQRMIAERDLIGDAMFMVQKEVGERILAAPGGKEYGLLSVMVALSAERERVMTLEPGSFSPPPKVRSMVVALRFPPPSEGFEQRDLRLLALLRTAFSERRKMLAANLVKGYGIGRAEAEAAITACGASPRDRAEGLAPSQFMALAAILPT